MNVLINKNEHMRRTCTILKLRIIAVLTAILVFTVSMPLAASAESGVVDSGELGENLTWAIYDDGILEVKGYGSTYDYSTPTETPFYPYRFSKDNDGIIRIKGIILPDGLTRIGDYVFYGLCDSGSLTIPSSVTEIGRGSFSYCGFSTYYLGDCLQSIGSNAFSGYHLTRIALPSSLSVMSTDAFGSCSSLSVITSDSANYPASDNVLFSDGGETLMLYPQGLKNAEYTVPSGVKTIIAMKSNRSLTHVQIPEGVTTIADKAFYEDSSLISVDLPESLSSIGNYAFESCVNLEEIYLSANVRTIPDYAFTGCRNLKTITVRNKNCLFPSFRIFPSDAVIYGYRNSTAETYAADKGYAFVPLDDIVATPEIILDQNTFTYDGTPKSPAVTVKVNDEVLDSSHYSLSGLGKTEPGEYTVTVTLKNGYYGSGSATYSIIETGSSGDNPDDPYVAPAGTPVVRLSQNAFTYDGKAKSPVVSVTMDGNTLSASDYTVSGLGAVNAGTYNVSVKLKSGYDKPVTAKYTISRRAVKPVIKLSTSAFDYDGSSKVPAVAVYVEGKKLTSSTYSLTCSARSLPGTYPVKITMKGNYSGTAAASYSIILRQINITKLKAKKKQFQVFWKKANKKQRKMIDGYQVQYANNPDFNKAITKTTKKNTSKKYLSKILKKKTAYYVRIRAFKKINGNKYYSPWSPVRQVKTK